MAQQQVIDNLTSVIENFKKKSVEYDIASPGMSYMGLYINFGDSSSSFKQTDPDQNK